MTLEHIQNRLALKDLVDTFSNLADEKKVAEQMALFTQDATVQTYIGGKLVFDMAGVAQIEQVFSDFLANFHTVYHINGQHSADFADDTHASATHYCAVKLVEDKDGRQILHDHSIRYRDDYIKQNGKWLITKRIAEFLISEQRDISA